MNSISNSVYNVFTNLLKAKHRRREVRNVPQSVRVKKRESICQV